MQKLENNKLDKLGESLVRAGKLPDREIDRIVADPVLFDSVRMRIALEGAAPTKRRSSLARPLIAAFASVIVVVVGTVALVNLRNAPDTASAVPPPALPIPTAPINRSPVPDRISNPTDIPPVVSERTANKPSVRAVRPRRPVVQQARYEGDFYALSYAGDPNETERGGRIVRVDISRSTLFAMGVDIPLENEAETVKADLLVGNDGVTRAIRVVR